jgi:hypothetical protein
MFQLNHEEAKSLGTELMDARLRSQNVTLKRGQYMKYRPYAFKEHGILMLSSVLHSERAIQVNIAIMRAFIRPRQMGQAMQTWNEGSMNWKRNRNTIPHSK